MKHPLPCSSPLVKYIQVTTESCNINHPCWNDELKLVVKCSYCRAICSEIVRWSRWGQQNRYLTFNMVLPTSIKLPSALLSSHSFGVLPVSLLSKTSSVFCCYSRHVRTPCHLSTHLRTCLFCRSVLLACVFKGFYWINNNIRFRFSKTCTHTRTHTHTVSYTRCCRETAVPRPEF